MSFTVAAWRRPGNRDQLTYGEVPAIAGICDCGLDTLHHRMSRDILGEGYALDPRGAVSASPLAVDMLAEPDAKPEAVRQCYRNR